MAKPYQHAWILLQGVIKKKPNWSADEVLKAMTETELTVLRSLLKNSEAKDEKISIS